MTQVVTERTTIDHAAMRVAVLQERLPLARAFLQQGEAWRKRLEKLAEDDEVLPMKDLVCLGTLLIRMAEVGAGLPKEHVVRHDEVHEEVRVNRRQIEEAKSDVVDFARWRAERGLVRPE